MTFVYRTELGRSVLSGVHMLCVHTVEASRTSSVLFLTGCTQHVWAYTSILSLNWKIYLATFYNSTTLVKFASWVSGSWIFLSNQALAAIGNQGLVWHNIWFKNHWLRGLGLLVLIFIKMPNLIQLVTSNSLVELSTKWGLNVNYNM